MKIPRFLRKLRRLNVIRRKAPLIEINQFGQLTDRPQVCVSIISRSGEMTIRAYLDNEQGNAGATLLAGSLANLTGLAVVDHRAEPTNRAKSDSITSEWHRLPRAMTDIAA